MAADVAKGVEVPYRRTGEGVVINVKVQPRSSKKCVAGVQGDALKVKLTAPPVGGAANEQLVEVLAEALGVRKSDIRIVRGGSSKSKVVEVRGVTGLGPFTFSS